MPSINKQEQVRCTICFGLLSGELSDEDDFWCLGHACIVNDEKGQRIEFTPDSQPENREGLINILRIVKKELSYTYGDVPSDYERVLSVYELVSAALEQIDSKNK